MPTAELHKALLAAQAEMPAVDKDGTNPHFRSKFTTLGNLIAKAKPVLNKHGIAFAQFPSSDEHGNPTLVTLLMHESGESLRETAPLVLTKQDPQGQGSAITYMRRYALAAALGISDQEDDDGNAASPPTENGSTEKVLASANQKRAITTILNKALVSKAFQAEIVHAIAGNPPTRAGASQILDILNKDGGTPESNVEELIKVADVTPPSDVPVDDTDLPPLS